MEPFQESSNSAQHTESTRGERMEPASRPPSWRTAEQVAESARRMDEALAAGLPPELLQIMLAARRAWWLEQRGEIGAWPDVYDLGRAVGDERSRLIDEVLYQVARQRVRRLSGR